LFLKERFGWGGAPKRRRGLRFNTGPSTQWAAQRLTAQPGSQQKQQRQEELDALTAALKDPPAASLSSEQQKQEIASQVLQQQQPQITLPAGVVPPQFASWASMHLDQGQHAGTVPPTGVAAAAAASQPPGQSSGVGSLPAAAAAGVPGQWPFSALSLGMGGLFPFSLDPQQLLHLQQQYLQLQKGAFPVGGTAAGPKEPRATGGGDGKAGRPPTFDDMVEWCIRLKRLMWQRHGTLITTQEAVTQVNKHFPLRTHESKDVKRVLVESTLRKRVP
jgi:hypothetical protein